MSENIKPPEAPVRPAQKVRSIRDLDGTDRRAKICRVFLFGADILPPSYRSDQVARLNSTRMGNISSRPASISTISTSLERAP